MNAEPDSPDHEEARKRIQKTRNLVFGGMLLAFVVLVYAISIAKMG